MALYPGGAPRGGEGGGSTGKLLKAIGDAMKGYSRFASEGKGLSDAGQQAYNRVKRASLSSGLDRYYFDVQQMLYIHPDTGLETFKGMYQLPGSPKYAGGPGSFEPPTKAQQAMNIQAYRRRIKSADRQAKGVANQYGGITTQYPRRYPPWVMQMLKGSELGRPPESGGSSKLPMGLALVALKVLL